MQHFQKLDALPPQARTLKVYDAIAQTLAARYEAGDRADIQNELRRHFGRGYEVLELGCGSGADAAALLRSGVNIYPTDGSRLMLAEAARLHPELIGRLQLIELPSRFPFEEGFFRGVIATTVLMHLPRETLSEVAGEIARVLRPGFTASIVVIPERQDLNSEGYDTDGRFFNRLNVQQIAEIFREQLLYLEGFKVVPDALGRTNVLIQSATFRRSASK